MHDTRSIDVIFWCLCLTCFLASMSWLWRRVPSFCQRSKTWMPLCHKIVTEWETSIYDRDRDKTAKFRKLCLQGLSKLVRILSFRGLENYEIQPDQNHSKKSLILATLRRLTQNSAVNQSLGPRKRQQTLKGNSRHGKIPFGRYDVYVYVKKASCLASTQRMTSGDQAIISENCAFPKVLWGPAARSAGKTLPFHGLHHSSPRGPDRWGNHLH